METTIVSKKLFTVEDCCRMLETGILNEDDRYELIEGELIDMGPMSSKHAKCILFFSRELPKILQNNAEITIQLPLHINDTTEPEPDIQVLKPGKDYYGLSKPTAEDVLLLIEVSLSSIHVDTNSKLPLYAKHGVCEVWIVDLEMNQVHQYTNPIGDKYKDHSIHSANETISSNYIEQLSFQINPILGTNS